MIEKIIMIVIMVRKIILTFFSFNFILLDFIFWFYLFITDKNANQCAMHILLKREVKGEVAVNIEKFKLGF